MSANDRQDEYDVALGLLEQGHDRDAFERCHALAQAGHVKAQLMVGWLFQTGRGVQADLNAAERWYRAAASTPWDYAQYYLACLYRQREQYQQAIEWLERAAAGGFPPAIYQLGRAHYLGEGVPVNREKAFEYFEQAARKGHLFAQRSIAQEMIAARRGIMRIPLGFVMLARILWSALRLGLKDPHSELILRQP